jgi:hypothetical protein
LSLNIGTTNGVSGIRHRPGIFSTVEVPGAKGLFRINDGDGAMTEIGRAITYSHRLDRSAEWRDLLSTISGLS